MFPILSLETRLDVLSFHTPPTLIYLLQATVCGRRSACSIQLPVLAPAVVITTTTATRTAAD
jgi:hypothetical protein